jgi:Protein of unknown function (DUF2933)
MTASTIFFVLLVLACPLMMMFMMRGGHGHGDQGGHAGGCHGGHGREPEPRETPTDDLRRQRAKLDREIKHREQWEPQPERELEPTGWGKR